MSEALATLMESGRFRLRTVSDWKAYGIFLIVCVILMVSVGVTVPPRLENLAIGMGGLALFTACFTPVILLATLPSGNWLELGTAGVRIKRWWISGLHLDYGEIIEIRAQVRHNPIIAFLLSSTAALEEHVDLVLRLTSVRAAWRLSGWLSFGNVIHLSPADPDSFVEALRSRLQGQQL